MLGEFREVSHDSWAPRSPSVLAASWDSEFWHRAVRRLAFVLGMNYNLMKDVFDSCFSLVLMVLIPFKIFCLFLTNTLMVCIFSLTLLFFFLLSLWKCNVKGRRRLQRRSGVTEGAGFASLGERTLTRYTWHCTHSVVQIKTCLFKIGLSWDDNGMTFRSWQMKGRDICDNRPGTCCMSIIACLSSWDLFQFVNRLVLWDSHLRLMRLKMALTSSLAEDSD